ncbi:mucin-4 isoform X3 [Cephus cinctus]|uniref:Mucin-4 isoform X3 n=1 Tax=Cephus cinctus TaxID=211228 RepID=A0AAJ7RR44_CEPCN|nr:mucin-4 isoform X3 [Cephus cinctus]
MTHLQSLACVPSQKQSAISSVRVRAEVVRTESDICTFAARTEHFHISKKPSTSLFTSDTRPKALRELYEAAAIVAVRSLDSLRRDRDVSSMDMFICTPVLGKKRRDQSLDIESRVPATIEDLRRWTSAEALGDVTVPPDCMSRIMGDTADDDAVDHKLPSPEEQVQAVALRFPAEIVAVDVSGRGFERMSMRRRSLLSGPESQETVVKRRSRPRRPRGKRRNTIAGTDQKEIRQAIGGEATVEEPEEASTSAAPRAHRSASTDILGSKKQSPIEKKSHFNTLKAWGRSRLKLISPKSAQNIPPETETSVQSEERTSDVQSRSAEETNIYETVTMRRRKEKSHERKPSSSSSSGKSTSSIPVSMPSTERQPSVKLRSSAAQRRERRKGNSRDDAPHSSSGNWSASSESGRASIGSETTTTTHQPRSTTTASIGTSSTSLSHVRRLKGRDTSASSSVTSEGTLTPDIIQDITAVPFSDDGETSSVYSCDTEGYYTSFHMDSGLKTLREEEPVPQTPLTKSNDLGSDPTSPIVENEYELFGRGSTSTTTSSAGTVCTALMAPPPPERKSSLTVVAMVHGQNQNGGESPDSGHNTSSSPVESASSPACTGRSCSEFEYSESSDLEGCERIERIRSKTAINTSRIPSMCVITPPASDDENAKDADHDKRKDLKSNKQSPGSVLMSATVGTSKMEVINGQDKNLYATVQTVLPSTVSNEKSSSQTNQNPTASSGAAHTSKINPLSGVLGKLRGVLPGRKNSKSVVQDVPVADSGDYVTIADVRNNNDKRQENTSASIRSPVTYANSDLFKKDAEYVSLTELPKKPDSSLERRRQGARVTLDSEGKVVYSSDSLKRRKGAHTTFNPGPFVKEGLSPSPSPLLHRAQTTVRAVTRSADFVDAPVRLTPPTSPQLGKLIIRAAKSPDRAASPDYVRTPTTIVGPTSPTSPHRQVRGAYVNVQGEEDSALLAIPVESVSSSQVVTQQPPPYVGPPQPNNPQKTHQYEAYIKDHQRSQQIYTSSQPRYNVCENSPGYAQHPYVQDIYTDNSQHRQCYEKSQELFERQNVSQCHKNQQIYGRQSTQIQNARNQQYSYQPCDSSKQQFYTLPSRRPQRDVEPPRSVTPDITRGLARGSLSAMHMLARQGQKPLQEVSQRGHFDEESQLNASRRNLEQLEARSRSIQNQNQAPVDVRNRFAAPLGLTAFGYRFFASSPVHDLGRNSHQTTENLRHSPISPIGPGHNNGFKSSTPTGRSTPTVAERLALTTGKAVGPAPVLSNSGRSTPVQNTSGRSTPTNLVLSPTKSTMSNEELFAAIHKSKRRLNIRDDGESLSPCGSMNSLVQTQVGTRHSWSPESQKVPEVPQTVQKPSATSRLDFKRLLLQQSVKTGPTRLSAAEQLKLSRQQGLQQQHHHHHHHHHHQQPQQNVQQTPPVKVLSPRSVWRFQTPRTDVLSSTIIEDAAAEEKAMKPSPENPSPISRINSRRQLDLCSDLPEHLSTKDCDNQNPTTDNRLTFLQSKGDNTADSKLRSQQSSSNSATDNVRDFDFQRQNASNNLSDQYAAATPKQNVLTGQRVSVPHVRNIISSPKKQEILNPAQNVQNTPRSHVAALSAFETRRMNNQLARAQFLGSMPVNTNQGQSAYYQKRFRARSESPQHTVTQNVARSPSAPTLETAL